MSDKSGKPSGPPKGSGDEGENDRPTVNPPFDVEAFARTAAGSHFPRDPRDAPTRPPPTRKAPEAKEGKEGSEPRAQQVTLTNEAELEKARAQSARVSEPPRPITSNALAIADARSKSSGTIPPVANAAPALGLADAAAPASIEAAVLGVLSTQPPPEITERTIDDPAAEMRERFSLGDYTGALEMSELILAEEPGNLEAAECGENCRTVLEGMFAAKLGALTRIPMVVVPRTQMRWLSIDHRAGFVLSLVDGSSSVEMILDVCGMPKLDALRILHELVQRKIVAFR
jgi:hypothetical protein